MSKKYTEYLHYVGMQNDGRVFIKKPKFEIFKGGISIDTKRLKAHIYLGRELETGKKKLAWGYIINSFKKPECIYCHKVLNHETVRNHRCWQIK